MRKIVRGSWKIPINRTNDRCWTEDEKKKRKLAFFWFDASSISRSPKKLPKKSQSISFIARYIETKRGISFLCNVFSTISAANGINSTNILEFRLLLLVHSFLSFLSFSLFFYHRVLQNQHTLARTIGRILLLKILYKSQVTNKRKVSFITVTVLDFGNKRHSSVYINLTNGQ